MGRKYDNSGRLKLSVLGICARCKINPRYKTDSYELAYCLECQSIMASQHYNRKKNGTMIKHSKSIDQVMLERYKRTAANRAIPFNLTDAQAFEIFHKPCHYCLLPVAMGIDRVDSGLDYDIENVVPCCAICNNGKLARTAEVYETWLQGAVDRIIAQRLKIGMKS